MNRALSQSVSDKNVVTRAAAGPRRFHQASARIVPLRRDVIERLARGGQQMILWVEPAALLPRSARQPSPAWRRPLSAIMSSHDGLPHLPHKAAFLGHEGIKFPHRLTPSPARVLIAGC